MKMRKEIITKVDPKSPVSEVFRALRTNLQYLNKKDGAQTILLTSTVQGEGKSFVASNLAVTFAQAGKKVVLLDSDMRRPRQHKLFNTDMYPGLSNYLSGVDINRGSHKVGIKECIYSTNVENLSILPAGNIPPNPSELLQGEKLVELLEELKELFDIVIVDGAPCLIVTDATLVSRLVDATVLVCSQGKTKMEDLKEAKTRIKRVGGNIVGAVLNRIKISNRKFGEKYYYYSNEDKALGNEVTSWNREENDEEIKERDNRRTDKVNSYNILDKDNSEIEEYEEETIKHEYTYNNNDKRDIRDSIDKEEYEESIEETNNNIEKNYYPNTTNNRNNNKRREYDRRKKSHNKKKNYDKRRDINNRKTNAEKVQEILAEINKVKEDNE